MPSDTKAKVINDGDKKVVYAGGRIIEEGVDYEVVSQDDTSITVNGISPYYQGTHTFMLSALPSDIEFIDTDELLEITPKNLRIRKKILDPTLRKRDMISRKNAALNA